jgi:hypothetical protein
MSKSAKGDSPKSPYEQLRLAGSIRAVIIGYGVGAMTLLLARSGVGEPAQSLPRQIIHTLLAGLGLQALLFVVRAVTSRYERTAGIEGYLSPLAVYIFELVVDGVTVFLFAWATYRGLLAYGTDL